MAALARSALVRGPGCAFHNPGASQITLPSVGGVEAVPEAATFNVETDPDGVIDERLAGAEAKISFTPAGIMTTDVFGVLFPAAYRTPVRGTSMHGATDTALLVHSVSGTKVTFHSVALTRMPTLQLAADKPLFGGAAEFTAIRKTGVELTAANSLYTVASGAYTAPAVTSASIKTQTYAAAWGDVIASIITEAGWTIEFGVTAQADAVDGSGTNDYILDTVTAVARCRPKNLSETLMDNLRIQDTSAVIGSSRRRAKNLVLTGTGLVVTLYDATFLRGPLRWAGVEVRAGEIAFAAHRSETAGVYGALFGFTFPA